MTVNAAGAGVFPLQTETPPLSYFKPTTRKTFGNAGDDTKLLWFSQPQKIYSARRGSACEHDLSAV